MYYDNITTFNSISPCYKPSHAVLFLYFCLFVSLLLCLLVYMVILLNCVPLFFCCNYQLRRYVDPVIILSSLIASVVVWAHLQIFIPTHLDSKLLFPVPVCPSPYLLVLDPNYLERYLLVAMSRPIVSNMPQYKSCSPAHSSLFSSEINPPKN